MLKALKAVLRPRPLEAVAPDGNVVFCMDLLIFQVLLAFSQKWLEIWSKTTENQWKTTEKPRKPMGEPWPSNQNVVGRASDQALLR